MTQRQNGVHFSAILLTEFVWRMDMDSFKALTPWLPGFFFLLNFLKGAR